MAIVKVTVSIILDTEDILPADVHVDKDAVAATMFGSAISNTMYGHEMSMADCDMSIEDVGTEPPKEEKLELFRTLNQDEVNEFREWARINYEKGTPINKAWHPVVQAECEAMNRGE